MVELVETNSTTSTSSHQPVGANSTQDVNIESVQLIMEGILLPVIAVFGIAGTGCRTDGEREEVANDSSTKVQQVFNKSEQSTCYWMVDKIWKII